MKSYEVLLICENRHHIRTRNTDMEFCPARAESADRGVYGPECGAEIVAIEMDIDDWREHEKI